MIPEDHFRCGDTTTMVPIVNYHFETHGKLRVVAHAGGTHSVEP